MIDTLTPAQRSKNMSRIRGKDTKPEMIVRRLTHAMGYRYRLHARELPGRPDLVFRPRRKAIFVHGCFWHRHEGCQFAYTPRSRQQFWSDKFESNVRRDQQALIDLASLGWQVLVIWECQTRCAEMVACLVAEFLEKY
jgi:DNA mismatch endonuclease, patch repair protein